MDPTTSTGPRTGLDVAGLLRDLQGLLKRVEDDLHRREQDDAATAEALKDRYAEQTRRERTGLKYADWRDDYLTQVAAAWVLSGVFLRYVEDNGWVEHPWLASEDPQERAWAEGAYEAYFRAHPVHSDRDYLRHVASEAAKLPGLHDLFDPRWNPIGSPVTISGDMAMALRRFWTETDPNTGSLRRSLVDPSGDTRFLGDLYQDLSQSARKTYALLQTPQFVADFLLDRTLEPAIDTFGLDQVRMIDPTCGSGHLLLGAFDRLFHDWQKREPGGNPREHVKRALDAVHGVDLNPFAVAIARFRLVVAALRACEVARLADAPDLDPHIHLAVGDSLLGGLRFDRSGRGEGQGFLETAEGVLAPDAYATETPRELNAILGRQYHAVVGNPPYITPKDPALSKAYRERYRTCYGQYHLSAPFSERFFRLAVGPRDESSDAGYVGLIKDNSFMKRDFGARLIEGFFPNVDLTHIIDLQWAHVPGHTTPTVILLGRNRKPISGVVRVVQGVRGQSPAPDDPSEGLVWQSILTHLDHAPSQSPFVTVLDADRSKYVRHPWSLAGGGASQVMDRIGCSPSSPLGDRVSAIGRVSHSGEDDAFYFPRYAVNDKKLLALSIPLIRGEDVRDWCIHGELISLFPYDRSNGSGIAIESGDWCWHFWPLRTALKHRRDYGAYIEERGLRWFDHSMFFRDRFSARFSICFSYKSTHNNFAFKEAPFICNRHAPLIVLNPQASRDDNLSLMGVLNSSLACFWIKHIFQPCGGTGIGGGIYDEAWEKFYELANAGLVKFPVVESISEATRLSLELDSLSRERVAIDPAEVVRHQVPTAAQLDEHRVAVERTDARMAALQEELDWLCYRLYGLLGADDPAVGNPDTWAKVPGLHLGQRPFEIVLARQVAAGEVQTSWFERHGSTPITEIPSDWADWYRDVVARRIELIESDPNIGLIERPEYKRRWQREPWDDQVKRALRSWLLDRLETPQYWPDPAHPELMSVARLADRASADPEFLQVAALYRGQEAVDVSRLIAELVASESVPFLPILRYTESGLRTRAEWRETWRLQRDEDEHKPLRDRAGHPIDAIPVPPKYTSKDFQKPDYWRLRGKLDVPKERFISYPGCERPGDPSLVVAWAGWDHLQQARAIATEFVRLKDEGLPPDRLVPLLAGIDELTFWLKLWHNALDPTMGMGLGDYFEDFVKTEALTLGYTWDQVRDWKPPAPERGARGRRGRNTHS